MTKGKVVLFPVILLCVLLIIGSLIAVCFVDNQPTKSIFDYCTQADIESDGYKKALDDSFILSGICEFGYAGDGEVDTDGNAISCIWFVTNLSEDIERDAKNIADLTEGFVISYSDKLGFAYISDPVKLQYCDDETFAHCPEDDYTALAEGYLLFDYSYRDADGVLWIAQVFSPQENILKGMLIKQINEEDFEGYEPQIDMREKEG